MPRPTSLAPLLGLFSALSFQEPGKDALPQPDPAITRAELEYHVRFLASDELGGRAPLSSGAERAANYFGRALEAAGIEPAGENGTFFQTTGLRRCDYPSLPRLLFTDETGVEVEAHLGEDFNLSARGSLHSTEKLPLRFFYDYNHSRMPLVGNPAEAIYFSASREDKQRILKSKGIESLDDWGLEFVVLPGDAGLEAGRPKDSFASRLVPSSEPDGCELIELRGRLRVNFDRRKYTHAQLLVEEVVEPREDKNVVGRIRGVGTSEHPELADEVVLLSANYDSGGTLPLRQVRAGADTLFNGADDNASGCAALLELAQALAAGAKPARTLVFLFTASEEEDHTGSRHYLASPAAPLDKTVAALCLERLGRPDELAGGTGNLWMTGYGRSDLGRAWTELGLGIAPDPRSDQRFYQRFHSYALVQGGLLANSLSSFGLQPEVGTPADEPDTLDYAHLEAVSRKALLAAGTLAEGKLKPARIEHSRPAVEDKRPARERRKSK